MKRQPLHVSLSSGVPLNLRGPISRISVLDIARGLSKINRFAGATKFPYSVAQHSLLVSDIVADLGGSARQQLAGLLHDAHEIVLSDVPTPAKLLIGEKRFADVEKALDRRIFDGLGLIDGDLDFTNVRHADMIACATEVRDVMVAHGGFGHLPAPSDRVIVLTSWQLARDMFLSRHLALTAAIDIEKEQSCQS